MDVTVPYNLTEDQLVNESTLGPGDDGDVYDILIDDLGGDEDALTRVFTAAICLKTKQPSLRIFQCLETALAWELG